MEITIVRTARGGHAVEGHLYVDGTYLCDTLEHPFLHLPETQDEPLRLRLSPTPDGGWKTCIGRSNHLGIRMGTGALHLKDGSIVVGRKYLEGVVLRTRECYERLTGLLAARGKRSPLTLRITCGGGVIRQEEVIQQRA